jgi:hypothetical protein
MQVCARYVTGVGCAGVCVCGTTGGILYHYNSCLPSSFSTPPPLLFSPLCFSVSSLSPHFTHFSSPLPPLRSFSPPVHPHPLPAPRKRQVRNGGWLAGHNGHTHTTTRQHTAQSHTKSFVGRAAGPPAGLAADAPGISARSAGQL